MECKLTFPPALLFSYSRVVAVLQASGEGEGGGARQLGRGPEEAGGAAQGGAGAAGGQVWLSPLRDVLTVRHPHTRAI